MTHLSPEALRAWYEQGSSADRDRVIGHLAECEHCRKALAALAIAEPLDVTPVVPDVETVRLGYAARRATRERGGWAAWLRPAYGLAGAAVVVFAVLWVTSPERSAEDNAVRSTELLALVPSGATGDVEFRWESPFDAARYRVVVRDTGGVLVFSGETTRSPFAGGAELGSRLIAGRDYTWQVTALDQVGDVIAESKPAAFRYQP